MLPPGPTQRFPFELLLKFRRQPVDFLSDLSAHYGDVSQFKIGRRHGFLLAHPDDVRDVLVTHSDNFTKGLALKRTSALLGNGLLTSEGDFHRRQRQLISPALHPNRVATYADDMVRVATTFCDRWNDGQQLDVHQEMMQLALRVVAKALFDTELDEEVCQIGQAVGQTVKMFDRTMMPWGPLLGVLPLPSNLRFARARNYLHQTIARMINRGRDRGKGDLLSILIATRDESGRRAMTDDQARDEALTLFLAGHETTANALTFTWHLLGQPENSPVLSSLHAELDAVVSTRPATAQDLPNLPYTRAVIAESMRLYPPAWAVGRMAIHDYPVRHFTIPAGSLVLLSMFVTHRDARFWPDPLRFDPQRWLSPADRPKYAYFPFGGGPRSCVGEAFAWTEATLLLATLAQRWKLIPIPGFHLELRPTITLRPRHGLPMTAHAR